MSWYDNLWCRRSLFLGGHLFVAFVIIVTIILPVRQAFDERDADILERREILARWRAVAAQGPEVQALATKITADHGEFLPGKNEGVVQADLQTRLKGMVEPAGARLRSIRGLQSKTEASARYVGARLDFHGNLQSVQRAVHAIESARPYLFVVASIMRPAAMTGPQAAAQEPTLEVQLEVYGIMRTEGGER